ncbi:MAG: hypothetical protein LUF33_07405 [Clostridiales bacterium]|nr:hypothetical protein [Clostridiales bacterium]
MPFINVKTNVRLDDMKKQSILKQLSKSITLIPGKSEEYVMCAVEDNIPMIFHGESAQPIAMVEVSILHSAPKHAYESLTAELCKIMQTEAGVDGGNCYVKFAETEYWGVNSFMF